VAYLKRQSINGEILAVAAADTSFVSTPVLVPHLQPGILYPAVANIMLDGATALSASAVGPNSSSVASSKYGTVQSDGRMYYYTDIAGSKPIKDPRIGAYFGSQRHKFKSLQLLEQETATHGLNVYSVDGREWIRAVGVMQKNVYDNDGSRAMVFEASDNFCEIVGYWNDANIMAAFALNYDDFSVQVNGGTLQATDLQPTAANVLVGRFVDSCHVLNIPFHGSSNTPDAIPAIRTLRINKGAAHPINLFGIELIAQDTTDTASKSKIQIPPQTVISQGKKFNIEGTSHYDPFNGFTNSTDLHSAYVDTATSLGLSTAIAAHGAPWAISGTNNIRPYNGGRVIKWVDSNGIIKTSVNVMPPNAQNISTTAAAEITTPSATNTHLPAFSDDGIDHSLADVAKTFYVREFGNGAANGGTAADDADASMLNASDDIAYVMDDGLTSLSGDDVEVNATQGDNGKRISIDSGSDKSVYHTFIGTGITIGNNNSHTFGGTDHYEIYVDGIEVEDYVASDTTPSTIHVAQNLPYGTHILRIRRVAANSTGFHFGELTIHQPKMPPIPEDAVVLADYMLMADTVRSTATGNALPFVHKGVRRLSATRDVLFDGSAYTYTLNSNYTYFLSVYSTSDDANFSIPFFGSEVGTANYISDGDRRDAAFLIDGSVHATGAAAVGTYTADTGIWDNDGVGDNASYSASCLLSDITLGLHTVKVTESGAGWGFMAEAIDIGTPIHTSSHYQTFETPYLHELVGGDRNMEQNNLVVTPDGKTWDEVTRDTSYIGKGCLSCTTDTVFADAFCIFDEWRGNRLNGRHYFNKDFAISRDRVICLKAGQYVVTTTTKYSTAATTHGGIYVNGVLLLQGKAAATSTHTGELTLSLERGDYVQIKGHWDDDDHYGNFKIDRI
jgi:hypothetical protein